MNMDTDRLDQARGKVLDQMERGQRITSFALGTATVLEIGLLVALILLVDWSDRTQVLIFLVFILSYAILAMGMVALAGQMNQGTARVLAALEARREELR